MIQSRVEQIEAYLIRNLEHVDLIVEQVLFLLPDGYFYTPEMNQGSLLRLREKLKELQSKMNSFAYKKDREVKVNYKKLNRQYSLELRNLSIRKRQELKDELLGETDEVKLACLINLIKHYNLFKRLRSFS